MNVSETRMGRTRYTEDRTLSNAVTIARLLGELDAVVGQDRVNLVRHHLQQVLQELPGRLAIGFLDQLRNGKFAGAVNRYKQI